MMHNVKIYAASKPVNPELYDLSRFASLFDQMQNTKRLNVTMLSMAAENQPGKHEWFVVETKHKAEKAVEDALRKAGVKVFLPLETIGETVVRGRIIPAVSRPLLPDMYWSTSSILPPQSAVLPGWKVSRASLAGWFTLIVYQTRK